MRSRARLRNAWAVLHNGRIEIWPGGGQLGIWNTKPKKDNVASTSKIARVEIRRMK